MSDTTFYYTKYKLNGTLTTLFDYDSSKSREERKQEMLTKYIQKDDPIVEEQSGTWYFGDVDVDTEQTYALGKFGKVYTEEPTIYDEEQGDFIDDETSNKDADYAMFILDFSNDLLIYNTKNRIGHKQFRERFSEGFKNEHNGSIDLNIVDLYNNDGIETVINEKTILKAGFELEPSNPSSDIEREDLDENIQEMLAAKLEFVAESENGLNMNEELLEQVVETSKTSCGIDYNIFYEDGENIKFINKNQNTVQKIEEKPKNLDRLDANARRLIEYGTSYLV